MCMECNTLVEGLNTDRFNSGFPQAMEETENPNSSSTTAGDIDVHETNEELSEECAKIGPRKEVSLHSIIIQR